jgi:hypothetical protein
LRRSIGKCAQRARRHPAARDAIQETCGRRRLCFATMQSPLEIADGLWIVEGPILRWVTMPFSTRMTIARLGDAGLFVHSPIPLTEEIRAFVAKLGEPRWIVSPNKLHHLFMRPWREAYASARMFAPPGLRAKRPDLAFDGDLGDAPDPAWSDEIDQLLFPGSYLFQEIVFFHKRSRTAIFGDLIENFDGRMLSPFHRFIARLGGVLAPNGKTPADFRLTFRGHRDQARESVRRILAWRPRAAIMCHGVPVFENATPFIESAFSWLGERRE